MKTSTAQRTAGGGGGRAERRAIEGELYCRSDRSSVRNRSERSVGTVRTCGAFDSLGRCRRARRVPVKKKKGQARRPAPEQVGSYRWEVGSGGVLTSNFRLLTSSS